MPSLISDADVIRLRRLLRAFEAGELDRVSPLGKRTPPTPALATLLGKTSEEILGTSGTTRVGQGSVAIYKFDSSTTSITATGTTETWFNMATAAVANATFVQGIRDYHTGKVFVSFEDCG